MKYESKVAFTSNDKTVFALTEKKQINCASVQAYELLCVTINSSPFTPNSEIQASR